MVEIQDSGQPQQIQAQPQDLTAHRIPMLDHSQELRVPPCSSAVGTIVHDYVPEEESKSALIDPGPDEGAGKQPQSFAAAPGEFSFSRDRDDSRERAQREIQRLDSENAGLRRQLGQMRLALEGMRREREDIRVPVAELKWLLYFKEPISRQQVMSIVSAGLAALFARDPSFRGRPCATSYAAQAGSDWRAFRVDFVGGRLVVLRKAMKAALANAHLPAAEIGTQQPPRVTLYRQPPELPPMFEGTLAELERALREAVVE